MQSLQNQATPSSMSKNNQNYIMKERSSDISKYMALVYLWMAYGLAITGATSVIVYETGVILELILLNEWLYWGIAIAQIVIVLTFSLLSRLVKVFWAMLLFFLFAFSFGLTFSVIFLVFVQSSIAMVFFVTSASFLVLSAYGYFTKKDLEPIGKITLMSLFGVIVVAIYNLFVGSETIMLVTTVIGVPIFAILTAYDTQRIKQRYISGYRGTRSAVHGALDLYLDFINLFLRLLILFGKRR